MIKLPLAIGVLLAFQLGGYQTRQAAPDLMQYWHPYTTGFYDIAQIYRYEPLPKSDQALLVSDKRRAEENYEGIARLAREHPNDIRYAKAEVDIAVSCKGANGLLNKIIQRCSRDSKFERGQQRGTSLLVALYANRLLMSMHQVPKFYPERGAFTGKLKAELGPWQQMLSECFSLVQGSPGEMALLASIISFNGSQDDLKIVLDQAIQRYPGNGQLLCLASVLYPNLPRDKAAWVKKRIALSSRARDILGEIPVVLFVEGETNLVDTEKGIQFFERYLASGGDGPENKYRFMAIKYIVDEHNRYRAK
jgi:hypothetical protein